MMRVLEALDDVEEFKEKEVEIVGECEDYASRFDTAYSRRVHYAPSWVSSLCMMKQENAYPDSDGLPRY
jgi:hypothetical protein